MKLVTLYEKSLKLEKNSSDIVYALKVVLRYGTLRARVSLALVRFFVGTYVGRGR